MRRILSNVLSQAGIADQIHAADGLEAVQAVAQEGIGLVLMDWNMPNLNGFDTLVAIRKGGGKMPIIMVTTEAEKSRILDALKAGANNYVIKPFTTEGIVAKIQETLAVAAKIR